jgi:hypothetical protein
MLSDAIKIEFPFLLDVFQQPLAENANPVYPDNNIYIFNTVQNYSPTLFYQQRIEVSPEPKLIDSPNASVMQKFTGLFPYDEIGDPIRDVKEITITFYSCINISTNLNNYFSDSEKQSMGILNFQPDSGITKTIKISFKTLGDSVTAYQNLQEKLSNEQKEEAKALESFTSSKVSPRKTNG